MDENWLYTLEALKDELAFMKLNFLSYHSLIKLLLRFKVRNPGMELNSNGVRIPVDKCGRTPLNYIPCLDKAIKRIEKGSSCYRRILLKQKLPGSKMYRGKLEKRLDITLRAILTEGQRCLPLAQFLLVRVT